MSLSSEPRQGGGMVRLDGRLTAWLGLLNDEERWSHAEGHTGGDDEFEWFDEPSKIDEPDGFAESELLEKVEGIDPQWLTRWKEFEESIGEGDQTEEG